ncbi:MAG: efflux RND transporter periplasmic adaptor subunit, partial [Clostridia bacterium]
MNKYLATTLILTTLLLFSCDNTSQSDSSAAPAQSSIVQPSSTKATVPASAPAAAPAATEATTSAVKPDLSVPPPGSQATPEKWAGFDEAKRKDAWDKYIAGLAPADSDPATGTTAATGSTTAPAAPAASTAVTPATTGSSKGGSIPVVVGELTTAPLEMYYYGLGEVEAGRTTKVSPPTNGIAVSLYVSTGDFVEVGDLLFSLDNGEGVRVIERASEKWDTELALAQVRYNEAVQALETSNQLFDRDLVTRQENDRARQLVEETRLALEKVQVAKTTELENLQENYRALVAVSPLRGYITAISFSRGESVNTADYIDIVNLETVLITVAVPENVISRVKQGAIVKAKQASAADFNLEGRILSRSLVADANRAYEVSAQLTNPDQRLLPGMLMETRIQIAQLTPRFVVPRETVVSDGGAWYIFIIENNIARRVPVQTGTSRGGFVQINGTLEKGWSLVLEGQSYLRDGGAVRVIETRAYLPERMD